MSLYTKLQPFGCNSEKYKMELFEGFKIGSGMLAKRTDEIVGKRITLVNVAADLANVTFFALCFGLGFYVVLIVSVSHGFTVGKHTRFGYGANEHTVCIKIHVLFYLEGHKRVDITGEEDQTVIGA